MNPEEIVMLVFAVLFAISEVLAQIPVLKSNSVFQLVYNILAALGKKKD